MQVCNFVNGKFGPRGPSLKTTLIVSLRWFDVDQRPRQVRFPRCLEASEQQGPPVGDEPPGPQSSEIHFPFKSVENCVLHTGHSLEHCLSEHCGIVPKALQFKARNTNLRPTVVSTTANEVYKVTCCSTETEVHCQFLFTCTGFAEGAAGSTAPNPRLPCLL